MKVIGKFTSNIIDLLGLDLDVGTPIFIGESNIDHIKNRHPVEFELYFSKIEEILSKPDYARWNSKSSSVDFVKLFRIHDDYIQVSVRVNTKGRCFAKTLFKMMTYRAERFIEQGTLKKVP